MALTERQRREIIERDGGTSILQHYSEAKGWYTGGYCGPMSEHCTDLHVHHIDTQRNGGGDVPDNLATLFACEHVGVCKQRAIPDNLALSTAARGKYVDPEKAFVVHPDITQAFMGYNGKDDYFKTVFEERNEKLLRGEVYWNTDHDKQLSETARDNSIDAGLIALGWMFHERKKK
ncbi:HNH endonuclease [Polynucleobacter sp.]|uniref:HNH endonuclease n=1 Tax=Polynucleobacter sp. TaxID=2029855 RepID=UPI003F6A26A1